MKKIVLLGLSLFLTVTTASAGDGVMLPEDDVISVYDRVRPDYDPRGLRTDSFIFRPSLELQEKFDDNIYATETQTEEDLISIVKPELEINSNWSRHALNALVGGDFGLYSDNNDENYQDYFAEVNSRLDMRRYTRIIGGGAYARKHTDRGYPESPSSAVEPLEYDRYFGYVGVEHKPGKLALRLDAEFLMLDYHDGVTATSTILDQDIRDRNKYDLFGTVKYEFIPRYTAFIEGGVDKIEYDQAAASGKDSEGYYVIGGTEISISGKSKGRIYAGYMSRDYESDFYEDIDGIKFGGDVLWNITELTSLLARVSRSIEESYMVNYSGFVLTEANLNIQHELRRYLLLAGSIGWENYNYIGNPIPEREDELLYAGIETKYLINRNFSAGLSYEYETRDSNISGDDYDRNIFSVALQAAF